MVRDFTLDSRLLGFAASFLLPGQSFIEQRSGLCRSCWLVCGILPALQVIGDEVLFLYLCDERQRWSRGGVVRAVF